MAKRKYRGNNRGDSKNRSSRSRGGGFGDGRGRGDTPVGFDVLDFPVQMWPEDDGYRPIMTPRGRGRGYRGGGYRGSRGPRGAAPVPRITSPSRGNSTFQSRTPTPSRGNGTPSRGIGNARGHLGIGSPGQTPRKSKLGSSAPLSSLLYESRPLLRPIAFVKSNLTPFLFQQQEELLKPTMEDVGDAEDGRIPTAGRIDQVIGGLDLGSEDIEEIDFNETEKLLEVQAKPYTMALEERFTGYYNPTTDSAAQLDGDHVAYANEDLSIELSSGNVIEGFAEIRLDSQPEIGLTQEITEGEENVLSLGAEIPEEAVSQEKVTVDDEAELAANIDGFLGEVEPQYPDSAGFFIDTMPSQIVAPSQSRESATTSCILGASGELGDDEEIIVYVAPHPRSGRLTPAVSTSNVPTTLPTTSMLTGLSTISEPPPTKTEENAESDITTSAPSASRFAAARKRRQFVSPLLLASPSTQRKAKSRVRMQEVRYAKQKKWRKRSMFSFGAEMQDKEWQDLDGPDPRWEERRRGDSDIDWGDEESEKAEAAGKSLSGPEGMDVDPELLDEKSLGALGSFANGMLSQDGSRYLTMDDIADIEKLKQEDEASEGGAEGSSGDDSSENEESDGQDNKDVDVEFEKEEEMLIGEDVQQSDMDDSEDELSSCSSFRQRLEFIRKLPTKKSTQRSRRLDEDDGNEAEFDPGFAWESDNYIDRLQDLVDEAEDVLADRKERKRLFKAINNGDFEDLSTFTVARRKKDKPTHLPLELQEQWAKDRTKKAEKKAERLRAQLEAAADPLIKKKGGKKGRKAMLAAARQDPRITVIGPNRVIDVTTLVQQIKRFIANPDGPRTMALPPASRETRKLVHEIAAAFDLKSKSNGHGDARYTTLIKTSRSGLRVNEAKVVRIMRRSYGGEFYKDDGKSKGKGKGGPPRQKEGEEVGKAAPKIDSSNRGFRLLEAMGWSEGKRIGITGGLDQPLMAIIKHSKLGLGATKQTKA